jgi:hypothetical protein
MGGGEVLVLRVSRAKVVRAARLAIRRARRGGGGQCGVVVDRALSARLLAVARDAPEFLLGGWWVAKGCGCLVGNLIGGNPHEQGLPISDPLWTVGLAFDEVLGESLSPGQRARLDAYDTKDPFGPPARVRVVG